VLEVLLASCLLAVVGGDERTDAEFSERDR